VATRPTRTEILFVYAAGRRTENEEKGEPKAPEVARTAADRSGETKRWRSLLPQAEAKRENEKARESNKISDANTLEQKKRRPKTKRESATSLRR
jgi:hypothetical protein